MLLKKQFLLFVGIITTAIFAIVTIPPIFLNSLDFRNTSSTKQTTPIEDKGSNVFSNPIRNAAEPSLPNCKGPYPTEKLAVGGPPKGGPTMGWPAAQYYSFNATLFTILDFENHRRKDSIDIYGSKYAVDIAVNAPSGLNLAGFIPVLSTLDGTVIELCKNPDGCGDKKAYGAYVKIRNARWICLNDSDVWKSDNDPNKVTLCPQGEKPPDFPSYGQCLNQEDNTRGISDSLRNSFSQGYGGSLVHTKKVNYEIIISHLNEIKWKPLNENNFKNLEVGTTVSKGDQLGTIGTMKKQNPAGDFVEFPMLHYEVWKNTNPCKDPFQLTLVAVDPEEYLGKQDNTQTAVPAPCCVNKTNTLPGDSECNFLAFNPNEKLNCACYKALGKPAVNCENNPDEGSDLRCCDDIQKTSPPDPYACKPGTWFISRGWCSPAQCAGTYGSGARCGARFNAFCRFAINPLQAGASPLCHEVTNVPGHEATDGKPFCQSGFGDPLGGITPQPPAPGGPPPATDIPNPFTTPRPEPHPGNSNFGEIVGLNMLWLTSRHTPNRLERLRWDLRRLNNTEWVIDPVIWMSDFFADTPARICEFVTEAVEEGKKVMLKLGECCINGITPDGKPEPIWIAEVIKQLPCKNQVQYFIMGNEPNHPEACGASNTHSCPNQPEKYAQNVVKVKSLVGNTAKISTSGVVPEEESGMISLRYYTPLLNELKKLESIAKIDAFGYHGYEGGILLGNITWKKVINEKNKILGPTYKIPLIIDEFGYHWCGSGSEEHQYQKTKKTFQEIYDYNKSGKPADDLGIVAAMSWILLDNGQHWEPCNPITDLYSHYCDPKIHPNKCPRFLKDHKVLWNFYLAGGPPTNNPAWPLP